MKTLVSSLIALFVLMLPSFAFSADGDDQVSRIQKAYDNITDMKGLFVQKNVIKDLNKTDTYSGEFFIKRPLKMKWIYRGKASQDLLINNDTAIIYRRGDSQAFRSKFSKEAFGQTPVVLLTGMGSIRDEFSITAREKSLILKPKRPVPGVQSVTVLLSEDEFPIRGFIISDGRSNTVEIEIRDIKTNTGIKDAVFDLNLPKGVSIYEQHS